MCRAVQNVFNMQGVIIEYADTGIYIQQNYYFQTTIVNDAVMNNNLYGISFVCFTCFVNFRFDIH